MSEPIIEYRDEFNVMDFASKYAERVSRVIDEQTLANVEHQLAEYGYVKVVRCRDCKHYIDTPRRGSRCVHWMTLDCFENPIPSEVYPDGYCAWGERRTNDN